MDIHQGTPQAGGGENPVKENRETQPAGEMQLTAGVENTPADHQHPGQPVATSEAAVTMSSETPVTAAVDRQPPAETVTAAIDSQPLAETVTGSQAAEKNGLEAGAGAVVTEPVANEALARPKGLLEPGYNYWAEFTKGIIRENPIFVIMLGLCPTLAVSTQVVNALGMGVAFLFVLLCSNVFISLLKDFIPDKVRIPSYIIIIASFVTIVDLAMQAWAPGLSKSLGVFVQLIVVNCIILGRAEAFASKNTVGKAVLDALGMGIGFTLSLLLIASIREVLSAGKITLFPLEAIGFSGIIEIPGLVSFPARVMGLAAGALLVMGLLLALFNWIGEKRKTAGKSRLGNPA